MLPGGGGDLTVTSTSTSATAAASKAEEKKIEIKTVGPYVVEPKKEENAIDTVLVGDYAGEKVKKCNEYSGVMRVPGVVLSRAEAEAIRNRFNLTYEQFPLDADTRKEGVYCLPNKNPAMLEDFLKEIDCSDFKGGLSEWMREVIDIIPGTEDARCKKMENAIKEMRGKPSWWESTGHSLIAAAAFVGLGIIAARLFGGSHVLLGSTHTESTQNYMGAMRPE